MFIQTVDGNNIGRKHALIWMHIPITITSMTVSDSAVTAIVIVGSTVTGSFLTAFIGIITVVIVMLVTVPVCSQQEAQRRAIALAWINFFIFIRVLRFKGTLLSFLRRMGLFLVRFFNRAHFHFDHVTERQLAFQYRGHLILDDFSHLPLLPLLQVLSGVRGSRRATMGVFLDKLLALM